MKPNSVSNIRCENTKFLNLFTTYFNFWYYLGTCPFKISFSNHNDGAFKTSTNKYQLFVFTALTLNELIFYPSTLIFEINYRPNYHKNIRYFSILYTIGSSFAYVCFLITIIFKRKKVEELLNFIHRQNNLSNEPLHLRNGQSLYKSSWKMVVGFLSLVFSAQIISTIVVLEAKEWKFNLFYVYYYNRGKTMINFVNEFHNVGSKTKAVVFTVGLIGMRIHSQVKIAWQSLLIISTIFMNQTLKLIQKELEGANTTKVLDELRKLKYICELTNEIVGVTAFGVMLSWVPGVIFFLPNLIQPPGIFDFADSGLHSIPPFIFLILAAKFSHNAYKVFENWINENKTRLRTLDPQLNILLLELSLNKISFEFGGIIKFSAGFLGAVTNLALTFAVVKIQFQENK